jgi:hypothetical protein
MAWRVITITLVSIVFGAIIVAEISADESAPIVLESADQAVQIAGEQLACLLSPGGNTLGSINTAEIIPEVTTFTPLSNQFYFLALNRANICTRKLAAATTRRRARELRAKCNKLLLVARARQRAFAACRTAQQFPSGEPTPIVNIGNLGVTNEPPPASGSPAPTHTAAPAPSTNPSIAGSPTKIATLPPVPSATPSANLSPRLSPAPTSTAIPTSTVPVSTPAPIATLGFGATFNPSLVFTPTGIPSFTPSETFFPTAGPTAFPTASGAAPFATGAGPFSTIAPGPFATGVGPFTTF